MTASINAAGLKIVMTFEGERLEPYKDGNGIWTIGYGHTEGEHEDSPAITHEEAIAMLEHDINWAEKAVSNALDVDAGSNEFSAMVSLCFNIGSGNFGKSTLLKCYNAGDADGAAAQFLKWCMIEGEQSDGLLRRRKAEKALFETPDQ